MLAPIFCFDLPLWANLCDIYTRKPSPGLMGLAVPTGSQSIYRTAKNEFLSATGWTIVEDVLRQSWAQMTVAGTLLGD